MKIRCLVSLVFVVLCAAACTTEDPVIAADEGLGTVESAVVTQCSITCQNGGDDPCQTCTPPVPPSAPSLLASAPPGETSCSASCGWKPAICQCINKEAVCGCNW